MAQVNDLKCYGKSWNPNAVECAGGLDPTYANPITGTQKRDKCVHYASCGTICVNNRQQQQPQMIPVNSLVRPPMQPPAAAALPNSLVYSQPPARLPGSNMVQQPQPQQQYVPTGYPQFHYQPPAPPPPQMQQYQYQYPYMHPQQAQAHMVPPSVAYYGPTMVPVNHQQPGMQILGYLSHPEPVDSAPWYTRLFRELFRSSMKGAFHTASNFFDHTTFGRPQLPPVPTIQPPL